MESVSVRVSFLEKAYSEACQKWKEIIRDLHPNIFGGHVKALLQQAGISGVYGESISFHEKNTDKTHEGIIIIPLPNANAEWTKDAWRAAMHIVDVLIVHGYDSYPVHGASRIEKERELVSATLPKYPDTYITIYYFKYVNS